MKLDLLPEENPVGSVEDEEKQREDDPGAAVDVERVHASALSIGGLGKARRRLHKHLRRSLLQKQPRRLQIEKKNAKFIVTKIGKFGH